MKDEIKRWLDERNRCVDTDIESHYAGMKDMGKWLLDIYAREAAKRAKFFENHNHRKFIASFFDFVQKRAKEMGYRYEDVILIDVSITDDGTLLLRVEPKPGAERIFNGES
jgi:hypothetical protein